MTEHKVRITVEVKTRSSPIHLPDNDGQVSRFGYADGCTTLVKSRTLEETTLKPQDRINKIIAWGKARHEVPGFTSTDI
ncbi:hypothetical protein H9L39_16890 [Fusarium oxysporum f. sp. albedinis]|nr:hypothetical protein H9L39_16890 [Fusarium oxysporum f. sp. albedinis]